MACLNQFRHIVANLSGRGATTAANTGQGFPASAVDLGRLKTVLEVGLQQLDMRQVRERWSEDVFVWLCSAVRAWVQRCKAMTMRPRRDGIHVRLETQDDHGY